MPFQQLGPRKVINKAYLRQKVARSDMEHFKAALTTLLDKIEDNSLECSAEHVVIGFLRDAYYKQEGHELIAKQNIDVAIFHGNNTRSDVGVLLEFKKPSEKYDMPSIDKGNFNENSKKIGSLMKSIVSMKQSSPTTDTQEIEKEIDKIVYDLYGLTNEKIQIIENAIT